MDGQEILLFPTPAIYQNYRATAGLEQQNVPLPAAALGDVRGRAHFDGFDSRRAPDYHRPRRCAARAAAPRDQRQLADALRGLRSARFVYRRRQQSHSGRG